MEETQDYNDNYKKQKEFFESRYSELQREYRNRNGNLFNDWSGFMWHYLSLRAGFSSLQHNPDTKDDPEFIKLCNVWTNINCLGDLQFESNRLKEIFDKLRTKPAFKNNEIFISLYGHFLKSIYQLISDKYYTAPLFYID